MRLFDLFDEIRLADLRSYIDVLKSELKISKAAYGRGRIRQVDVYCLLKGRFGPPNGMQSFLRGNHADNIFHWEYTLTTKGLFLNILSSTRFLEIRVLTSDPAALAGFNGEELVESLELLIKRNKKDVDRVREGLEFWHVFLNTYKRLESTTAHYYEQYAKVACHEPTPISHIATEGEMKAYNHQIRVFVEKVTLKQKTGLVLRMLYPVQAESLANLVLFMLAKKEVKTDKRLMDSAFREQIDIRVKTLHLKCNGLLSPYDPSDERFKSFLRLMDRRNDLLHGNILPVNSEFDQVYFDGTVPLFLDDKDLSVEYAKQNLFQVTEAEVEADHNTVLGFRDYLLSNIDPKLRPEVEIVMGTSQLGWNAKTGRLGVLFGDVMVQPFFIKGKAKRA